MIFKQCEVLRVLATRTELTFRVLHVETSHPFFFFSGRWITPIVMTIYLLVANILLINLLIASFNTIYNSVNARSLQFWNFQRFSVVLEYEEKPVWPAPLTIFSHIYRICKFFYRKCKGQNSRFESGLKLFLSKFDGVCFLSQRFAR